MFKRIQLACAVSMLGITNLAHAGLIGVSQGSGNSSFGVAAAIIGAPSDALDDLVTNTAMQGFDEAQGVLTTVAHAVDGGGSIAAGTLVDSHMIFLNSDGNTLLTHQDVTWTFSGLILGVMSDGNGVLEAASTFELGAPGTNYTVGPGAAPFGARGLEGGSGSGDGYSVLGNTITVSMRVTEPGDWIRVVTAATPAPEPGALGLAALALVGGLAARTRRRA